MLHHVERKEPEAIKKIQPKVSIVVPVYNCAEYLEKCLDSLVNQTISSKEIIVVNDGSTDNSQEIIDSYAAKYPDLIVALQKENGGLSDARNFGAKHALGLYIGFIDSDDYVEKNMYSSLYKAIRETKSRIAIGQYFHHKLAGASTVEGRLPFENGAVFDGNDFLLHQHVMVVWNKLYHRDIVRRFPFPITWFEDVAWTPVVMSHTRRVCYVEKPFYHYVRREGSIASSHFDPRTLEGIKSVRYALKNSKKESKQHVEYMAAKRLVFEARVRKTYSDRYLSELNSMRNALKVNPLVLADSSLMLKIGDYLKKKRNFIPRIIYHAADSSQPFFENWMSVLLAGDGKLVSVDPGEIVGHSIVDLLKEAGNDKALSEFARLLHVAEHGGISISNHVRANKSIAPLLLNGAVFGLDFNGQLHTEMFAAAPKHPIVLKIVDAFIALVEKNPEHVPLSAAVESVLKSEGDFIHRDSLQEVGDGVWVYPSKILAGKINGENICEIVADEESNALIVRQAYVDHLLTSLSQAGATAGKLKSKISQLEKTIEYNKSLEDMKIMLKLPAVIERSAWFNKYLARRKVRKTIQASEELEIRTRYAEALTLKPLVPKSVLLESMYGRGMLSSPRALFDEWRKRDDFSTYHFTWVLDDVKKHRDMISDFSEKHKNVRFVNRGSREYYEGLATSEILINDVTFFFDFVKRPGQFYVNTWHSITVKSLGYDIPGKPLDQKNVVRNMLAADILVAANDFMKDEIFGRAHRMDTIMPGEMRVDGHPRNDMTLTVKRAEIIEELSEFDLELDPAKKTILYAPTWRGKTPHAPTDSIEDYEQVLKEIDQADLAESYNVLLKLHPSAYVLAGKGTMRARFVPPTIDANRLFAAVDVLITDYSSIFFDFMVTGKPILFYLPDKASYEKSRGIYFQPQDLPGPVFEDISSLAKAAVNPDTVAAEYAEKYKSVAAWACPHDDGSVSERLLHDILNRKNPLPAPRPKRTSKSTALIYAGSLAYEPQVAKLQALLTQLQEKKVDITILVTDYGKPEVNKLVRKLLDQGVRVIGRSRHTTFTETERTAIALLDQMSGKRIAEIKAFWQGQGPLHSAMVREWQRCVGDARFDFAVNLETKTIFFDLLCQVAPADLKLFVVSEDKMVTTSVLTRKSARNRKIGYDAAFHTPDQIMKLWRRHKKVAAEKVAPEKT